MRILIVLSFLLLNNLEAAIFSKYQMQEIKCASTKMQLFYFYLKPDRSGDIKDFTFDCKGVKVRYVMPQWIDSTLANMVARKVWKDPEEGEISEADLWRTSVSIIYEFLEITKKTFPPEEGGPGIQPALLVKEYADVKIRFQMSLDRLYRARLGDSFDGRGRTLLAIFNLILKEMEAILESIATSDPKKYNTAVVAISVLSQDAFSVILKPSRNYEKITPPDKMKVLLWRIFGLISVVVVFVAVMLFFVLNEDKTKKLFDDYKNKAEKWREEFSRQFLEININYLVGIPIVLFGLLGIFTMSIFGFLFFIVLGVLVGLRLPKFVLRTLKMIRGKKIDSQLMDAIILMSNSLKSGLDIIQGFEMVSKDLLPPISEEFALVIKNYQLGMPFEKALMMMEERIESKMLSYMIRAIILQRQIGGNLTKVFERIVIDIREESKLEEKTKALTAQQRIQSIVVAIMPWIMVSVMFVFQPDMMIKFYATPFGLAVAVFCLVWMSIGIKVVASLGKIRV
ncbi:MAG: type II secretion system F family protein [Candidatus Micrarchaeota archaeon]|nr:type II secretion system F family protein [Candidatus Micrarchaeota archaeon]